MQREQVTQLQREAEAGLGQVCRMGGTQAARFFTAPMSSKAVCGAVEASGSLEAGAIVGGPAHVP